MVTHHKEVYFRLGIWHSLRLNSQNEDQVTTARNGNLSSKGWSPSNPSNWFSMYFWYFRNYAPRKPSKMDNYWMIVEFFSKLDLKMALYQWILTLSHKHITFDSSRGTPCSWPLVRRKPVSADLSLAQLGPSLLEELILECKCHINCKADKPPPPSLLPKIELGYIFQFVGASLWEYLWCLDWQVSQYSQFSTFLISSGGAPGDSWTYHQYVNYFSTMW